MENKITKDSKVIPTMVTSLSHDRELKVQYPNYDIEKRSYKEVSRLLDQRHEVVFNDNGLVLTLNKDKLDSVIVPYCQIDLKENETVEKKSATVTEPKEVKTDKTETKVDKIK